MTFMEKKNQNLKGQSSPKFLYKFLAGAIKIPTRLGHETESAGSDGGGRTKAGA